MLPPTLQFWPSLTQRPEKQQPLSLHEPPSQQGSPGPPQVLHTPARQMALLPHGVAPAQQIVPGIPQGLQTASGRDGELHSVCFS